MTMSSSIYTPLQVDNRRFRLLALEHSADSLAPLYSKLYQVSFDNSNLQYTALSYTWGDPLVTTSIFVNSTETQVTLNLEAALRYIRHPSQTVLLWVDALCINQRDVSEKNYQVKMMRDIFSGAQLVIAWLGIASDDSDFAMEVIGKGERAFVQSGRPQQTSDTGDLGYTGRSLINDEQGNDRPLGRDEDDLTTPSEFAIWITDLKVFGPTVRTDFVNTGVHSGVYDEHQDDHLITNQSGLPPDSPPHTSTNCADAGDGSDRDGFLTANGRLTTREVLAIPRLLRRPWWSRVWVVQEVLLAKMVVFKCGHAEVRGEQINQQVLEVLLLMLANAHDGSDSLIPAIMLLFGLTGSRDMDAIDCFFEYGMREATKPHDHIYGLLGLLSEKDRLLLGAPDYSCRVEDLFIDVTVKLITDDNSLRLLLAAGMPAPPTAQLESSVVLDMPSWVPRWTRLRPFSEYKELWDITPSSKPMFYFSEDMAELTIEGYEFDRVEDVKPVPKLARGKMPIWQNALEPHERTLDDGELPPLQRIILALHMCQYEHVERLDDENGFETVAGFFQELENYRVFVGGGHSDTSDYLAGFLYWIGERRNGRTDEQILEKLFSVKAAQSFMVWYHTLSMKDLQLCYFGHSINRNTSADGTTGCSMFRTYKGSFGVTRAAVAAGDLICVMPSCPAPLLLRKALFSKYSLVGPTYPIHGTMKGELSQAATNSEITKASFTLV